MSDHGIRILAVWTPGKHTQRVIECEPCGTRTVAINEAVALHDARRHAASTGHRAAIARRATTEHDPPTPTPGG